MTRATTTHTEPTVSVWEGLYKDRWVGTATNACMAHPAKFSKGLIFHIIQHAIDEDWVRPGDTVIDPFGGVGLGGLPCALRGLQHLAVELEPRFVALANGAECGGDLAKHEACSETGEHGPHHILGNLELWRRKYGVLPQWKQPILLQGDSRELGKIISQHLAGSADLSITSSPFQDSDGRKGGSDLYVHNQLRRGRSPASASMRAFETATPYGTHPDNLGNMKNGSLDAALAGGADLAAASPPYADGCTHTGGADPQPQHVQGGTLRYVQYGADCAVSSSPWTNNLSSGQLSDALREELRRNGHKPSASGEKATYGTSPAQLGAMPPGDVAAVVQGDLCAASPPFENSLAGEPRNDNSVLGQMQRGENKTAGGKFGQSLAHTYGSTSGNIGAKQGDTFWSAAKTILEQTWACLRSGAHAIWVTKHYIRDGKLVDFPGDWRRIAQHVGFVTVHIHLAMLVERRVETHLFENEITYEEWKESFFRKINRRKSGVGIEFEAVICQVKPHTAESLRHAQATFEQNGPDAWGDALDAAEAAFQGQSFLDPTTRTQRDGT